MKKIGIAATIIGFIIFAIGIIMKLVIPASIGYIGGADGPTATFIAGKIGSGPDILMIGLGIIILLLGLVFLFRKKRK